ncbi:MAG: methionine--tRNA ligase [Chloroflexi bacterium]|nr:methionine--tRNA ligase [Chloroflexota bacterium]
MHYFITTPIYYANDAPHIGHAYTTIAADVLARYHRRVGDDVFFLTGTDEHGAKIAEAARQAGMDPQTFTDRIAEEYRAAWGRLEISHDGFIRTTSPRHKDAVGVFLQRLYDAGDVYRGRYEGFYCVGCERFLTEDELVSGLCPLHNRPPVPYAEDNYFFRLSRYQDALIRGLTNPADPNHYEVDPPARRNEVLGKLNVGLSDISISRATLTWGIPLPFDPGQTTYVWVDALINYVSAIGYVDDPATFQRYWPANLHLMAKDILWFHAIVWPAMLLSAGLALPRRIYAHGFFTIGGQKMSKTLGNIILPAELVERFGADASRYLLLSEFPFGTDGDVSLESMTARYNADLANDVGNLLNRTVAMVNRYCQGAVPEPGPAAPKDDDRKDDDRKDDDRKDEDLRGSAQQAVAEMHRALGALEFHAATAAIRGLATRANKYVDETAPWVLARSDRARLGTVLHNLVETERILSELAWPFLPSASEEMASQLGVPLGVAGDWSGGALAWGQLPVRTRVAASPRPLFPKLLT